MGNSERIDQGGEPIAHVNSFSVNEIGNSSSSVLAHKEIGDKEYESVLGNATTHIFLVRDPI